MKATLPLVAALAIIAQLGCAGTLTHHGLLGVHDRTIAWGQTSPAVDGGSLMVNK